jgi:hypothetical protein
MVSRTESPGPTLTNVSLNENQNTGLPETSLLASSIDEAQVLLQVPESFT